MTFAATAARLNRRPTGARRLARLAGLALISWSRGRASATTITWSERALANDIARGAERVQARHAASLNGYVVLR